MPVTRNPGGSWKAIWSDYTKPRRANGKPRTSSVTVSTKGKARAVVEKMKAAHRDLRAGLSTAGDVHAAEHDGLTLADQLPDYAADLRRGGRSPEYVRVTRVRLAKLLRVAPFRLPAEVTREGLRKALEAFGNEPLPRMGGRRPGRHTLNKAASALKTYLEWMVENKRLAANPLAGKMRLPKVTEVVHPRRAGDAEDFGKLVDATLETPTRGAWDRLDRWALLQVMWATGYRVGECRSLTPESFRFSGEPVVIAEAAYTKNRKRVEQPISRAVAAGLLSWLMRKSKGRPVFPMGKRFSMAAMMRSLCKRAGVPYRDAEGFLDGHALRHSYITAIASRTDVKTTQSLARHSTPGMTMAYMHTDDDKRRKAVEGK
jgi:integrase